MAQDSRVARIHSNHNVYILGAGFSRDAGLPLISDFLIRMRDSIGWLAEQNREKELTAVENVFKFMLAATGTAYRVKLNVENIEELFSLASASGSDPLAKDVSTAIAATLDFARQNAEPDSVGIGLKDGNFEPPITWESRAPEHPAKAAYVCSEYDIYAGWLSGKLCRPDKNMRNTVITFNYDTLMKFPAASCGVSKQVELFCCLCTLFLKVLFKHLFVTMLPDCTDEVPVRPEFAAP